MAFERVTSCLAFEAPGEIKTVYVYGTFKENPDFRFERNGKEGFGMARPKAAEMDECRQAYDYRHDRLDSGGRRICALELQHGVALARLGWFPYKLVW